MTAPSAFSHVILDHFRRPRHRRALAAPTSTAELANPLCGDRVRVELAVDGAVIVDAAFTADACAICVAATSLMVERVRGLTLDAARAIDGASVMAALESPIPAGRVACALLPHDALRAAIASLGAEAAAQ